MNFLDKFNQAVSKIDNQAPKARYDDTIPETIVAEALDLAEPLYNVHKRSLPVGVDKVILWNITKAEFEAMKIDRHDDGLVKELKGQCKTTATDDGRLVYYDLVPVNATAAERSVYYNPAQITRESGVDEQIELIPVAEWID